MLLQGWKISADVVVIMVKCILVVAVSKWTIGEKDTKYVGNEEMCIWWNIVRSHMNMMNICMKNTSWKDRIQGTKPLANKDEKMCIDK